VVGDCGEVPLPTSDPDIEYINIYISPENIKLASIEGEHDYYSTCAFFAGSNTMPFDLDKFVSLRPFAYHLTDRSNVSRLRQTGIIQPAATLLRGPGRETEIRQRRKGPLHVIVDGDTVVIRDQRPLIFANIALWEGWASEDFTAFLNEHVYFWPGDSDGPVKSGLRLQNHYVKEQPAFLRIPTRDLFDANCHQPPLFCPFISGAPRKQAGKAVPRGPDLFQPADSFPRTAGQVVELVFRGTVQLPSTTVFGD
jgi:hypothetical protein